MGDRSALAIECLAAVSGVFPEKPLKRGQVTEAIGIPKAMERAVKTFFESDAPTKLSRPPRIRYLATWKRLNESQDDSQLAAVIVDPAASRGLGAKLDEARAYLRDQWRPTTIETLVGPSLLTPSDSEDQRCQSLFAIVNDPRGIVASMSAGCVMSEETAAVKAVFPETFAMIGDMINAELFKRKLDKKSYRVPYHQELSIRAFAGLPMSASVERINEQSAPPTPELSIPTKSPDKNDAMTKADRVDSGGPA